MKKSSSIALIVVVVVVAIAGALYVVTKGRSAKTTSNPQSSTSSTNNTDMSSGSNNSNASTGSTNPQTTNKVTIQNFAFSPASITVKAGTTVTWTNNDSAAHTVTENDGKSGGPASGDVNPGSTYSFTFKTAGTYQYHCAIHPSMTGTVVVTQ
jgi:plastocyanin